MKKLLLLCAFSITICLLHAQTPFVMPSFKEKSFSVKTFVVPFDSATFKKLYQFGQNNTGRNNTIDHMPIVSMQVIQLTYIGNNNQGLDIYKAQLDNMPVVKPDSTFYSAMPAAGK